MKSIYLSLIALIFISSFSFGQQTDTNREKQKEKFEKELQKRQNELINDFVNELEVDEFQQEIITQKLMSYVQKKQIILRSKGSELDKKEQIDNLDDTHFQDISGMASKEVMMEIQDFIKTKHPINDRKKKREKKRKKSQDDSEQ